MAKYTDKEFFMDVLAILDEVTVPMHTEMREKCEVKLEQLAHRAEYSATHRKPSASKVSPETKARAAEIASVLTDTPMTAAEINAALGKDYSALQIANAAKYIDGVANCKVIRETVTKAGLRAEKEYTAYFLG